MLIKKRYLSIDPGAYSYKIVEGSINPLSINRFDIYKTKNIRLNRNFYKAIKIDGYHAKNVILAFNHPSIIIRDITVPKEISVDSFRPLNDEILSYYPNLLRDYVYDYRIACSTNQENEFYLTLAACPKNIIDDLVQDIRESGLKPKIIDVQANTSFRLIQFIIERCGGLSDKYCYLLIDFGHTSVSLSIISSRKIYLNEVIDLGVDSIYDGLNYNNDRLRKLVSNCISFIEYFHQYKTEDLLIKKGFLYGGGSYLPKINLILENKLGLKLDSINSCKHYIKGLPKEIDLNIFANSIGLLLREEIS